MKKASFLTLLAFLTIMNVACAQQPKINGVYADSTSGALQHCYAVFSQQGDSIFMTHYLEFDGSPFVEHGAGVVKGDSIIYGVRVTLNGPNWPASGVHRLKIEDEGNVLRGTYHDANGNTGPLILTKRYFK